MSKLSKIGTALKHTASIAKAGLKEHSPEIMVYGGIILLGAAAVVAVKKATDDKMDDILMDHDEEVQEIITSEDYKSEKERKKELANVQIHYIFKLGKHFAIPAGLFVLGTTSILAGHNMLKKRYVALGVAYNSLQTAYDNYSRRIKEKYGEEADKYGRYGIETKTVTVEETDPETGKTKKVKEDRDIVTDPYGLGNGSPYFRVIGEDSALYKEFGGNPLYIRNQLELFQNVFNQQYQDKNPLYTNDIYRAIFGPDERILDDNGQMSGYYIEDPVNKDACDGYVDLRIGSAYVDDEHGDSHVIFYIDPNVPGEISLARAKEYRESLRRSRRGGKYISM